MQQKERKDRRSKRYADQITTNHAKLSLPRSALRKKEANTGNFEHNSIPLLWRLLSYSASQTGNGHQQKRQSCMLRLHFEPSVRILISSPFQSVTVEEALLSNSGISDHHPSSQQYFRDNRTCCREKPPLKWKKEKKMTLNFSKGGGGGEGLLFLSKYVQLIYRPWP